MNFYYFKQSDKFPIYPLTSDLNYNQERIYREFGSPFHQIFIVSNGTGFLKIADKVYNLCEGDMFFLEKDYPHEYWGDENFKTTYLSFLGDFCESIFEHYGTYNYGVFKNKNCKKLYNFIDELHSKDTDRYMRAAKTYLIVTAFFDEVSKENQTPLQIVKNFIELKYTTPISLNDILPLYPYSKTKLCNDFLKEFGTTIFEMITELRLNYAKAMLVSNPYCKLTEVANSCGYNDVSYFCKMFKSKYGITPSHYKELQSELHKNRQIK